MMRPGLGGLPPQRPDQRYLPPAVGVQPGSAAGIVRARQVIIAATNAGIFVYSPTAAAGNLIGSWASSAGTDPYTNSYPQGLNVTVGTIAGSTITGSLFRGTTFNLNSTGFFLYSGTPAAGNLIASIASSAGTDTFGNAYRAGFASYSGTALTQLITGTLQAGLTTDNALSLLSAGQGHTGLTSGSFSGDIQATIGLYSASAPSNPGSGATVQIAQLGGLLVSAAISCANLTVTSHIGCNNIDTNQLLGHAITGAEVSFLTSLSKTTTPSAYPLSTDPFTGASWGSGERSYINQCVNAINEIVQTLQNNGFM